MFVGATAQLWPARLGQGSDNYLLQGRLGWNLCSEHDHLGYVGRVLQILFLWQRNTQVPEAIEEVCAHTAGNDSRNTDTIRSPFDSKPATKTDQSPLRGMVGRGVRPRTSRSGRGDVDKMARVLSPHDGERCLREE